MLTERGYADKAALRVYQRMFQVVDQLAHILIAALRIFLRTLENDLLKRIRQIRCLS